MLLFTTKYVFCAANLFPLSLSLFQTHKQMVTFSDMHTMHIKYVINKVNMQMNNRLPAYYLTSGMFQPNCITV